MTPEEAALLNLIDGNRRIKGLRGKAKVPYVGTPLGNEGSEKYLMCSGPMKKKPRGKPPNEWGKDE